MDWKEYEDQILQHLKHEFPDFDISYDQRIMGRYSTTKRQIDILLEGELLNYSIRGIVDCKCFSKKVDVTTVDQFIGFVADTEAQIGVLITNKGFTPAAQERAKNDPQTIHLEVISFRQLESWSFDKMKLLVPITLASLSKSQEQLEAKNFKFSPEIITLFDNVTPMFLSSFHNFPQIDRHIIDSLCNEPYAYSLADLAKILEISKQRISARLMKLRNSKHIVRDDKLYRVSNPLFVMWYISRNSQRNNAKRALNKYLINLSKFKNYKDARYVKSHLRRLT